MRGTARHVVCLGALCLAVASVAAERPLWPIVGGQGQNPPSPRLLVMLVVDQFRFDHLDTYGSAWAAGLARLKNEGAVYSQTFYPFANTHTCTGHATISTGALPYRHGVIMNEWYRRKRGSRASCVDDPSAQNLPYGPRTSDGGQSAVSLKVPTIGERVRAQSPASRVVSISTKAGSAIMLGARSGGMVTWYAQGAAWATSTAYTTRLVPEVRSFVDANPVVQARGEIWNRLRDPQSYVGPDAVPFEGARTGWTSAFPHPLAGAPGTSPGRFDDLWGRSPYSDAYRRRGGHARADASDEHPPHGVAARVGRSRGTCGGSRVSSR